MPLPPLTRGQPDAGRRRFRPASHPAASWELHHENRSHINRAGRPAAHPGGAGRAVIDNTST
ncbi:MAG: hypothetical protein JWN73_4377, partial [Betaproteobacteria bacterium]|nr:hypothetical protein [Betaproteobacteria bacterium]